MTARAAATGAVAVEAAGNPPGARADATDPQATEQYDELAAALEQHGSPSTAEPADAVSAEPVAANGAPPAGSGPGRRAGRRRNAAAVKELDVDDLLVEVRPPAPAPAPRVVPAVAVPTRRQVRAARRLQARKVGRLVRHIDLWSLLKVSLLFYVCMLLVGVVAAVLVWSALQRSGAVGSVEGFVEEIFLLENFRFEGTEMFRIAVLGGMVGVLVATLLTVLGGLLFNLISDLTGGVRVSVVQLESARVAPRRSRR